MCSRYSSAPPSLALPPPPLGLDTPLDYEQTLTCSSSHFMLIVYLPWTSGLYLQLTVLSAPFHISTLNLSLGPFTLTPVIRRVDLVENFFRDLKIQRRCDPKCCIHTAFSHLLFRLPLAACTPVKDDNVS